MTTRHVIVALLASVLSATPWCVAQSGGSEVAVPSTPLTTAELEELLGPIALYPDALLANVLTASVYPDEVSAAAAYVNGGGDPKGIESQPWEAPVKAVAKVPDVIKMMGEYADWTVALGQAYLSQAQGVMQAVQSLRAKANSNGALRTTEQQTVVVEQETIYIQPSDPEIIYVPSYEPSVVYVDHYDSGDVWAAGAIGFGAGLILGAALDNIDCDWNNGCCGWGNADVDIDRNITTGDINVGNNVGSGNRVGNGNRVGKEGGAWSPNRSKQLASSKPNQLQSYRGGAAGSGARATPRASSASRPGVATRSDSAARAGSGSRTGAAGPAAQPASGRKPTPAAQARPVSGAQGPAATGPAASSRVPKTPPAGAGGNAGSANRNATGSAGSGRQAGASRPSSPSRSSNSAFSGGSNTRATSSRGASSRQSAQRSSGGRSGGGGRRR
jgi:hypothetical protein